MKEEIKNYLEQIWQESRYRVIGLFAGLFIGLAILIFGFCAPSSSCFAAASVFSSARGSTRAIPFSRCSNASCPNGSIIFADIFAEHAAACRKV